MQIYETTFVIDAQLKPLEIEETLKKVTNFITNHGGEIIKIEEWGKRRLAYEINKKLYGHYVHIRFTGPGQLIGLLEREYRLMESMLRYLTIKLDKLALKAEAVEAERAARKAAEAAAESAAASASKNAESAEAPAEDGPGEADTAAESSDEAPAEAEKSIEAESADTEE